MSATVDKFLTNLAYLDSTTSDCRNWLCRSLRKTLTLLLDKKHAYKNFNSVLQSSEIRLITSSFSSFDILDQLMISSNFRPHPKQWSHSSSRQQSSLQGDSTIEIRNNNYLKYFWKLDIRTKF